MTEQLNRLTEKLLSVSYCFQCIFLIVYFFDCAGSLLLSGLFSSCGERGLLWLWCVVSLQWLLLLQSMGSRALELQELWHMGSYLWLSGSRTQAQQLWHMAQLLCGTWDRPGPGIKPVSPGLAKGLLTVEPPGKPSVFLYNVLHIHLIVSLVQYTFGEKCLKSFRIRIEGNLTWFPVIYFHFGYD